MKNNKGMTLVEVMVSTIIFMFVVGGLITTLFAGNVSWQNHDIAVKSQQEARKVITVLTRDLRVASGISITQDSNNLTMTFSLPSVGAVSYTWSTTGGSANQLLRTTATSTRIIAQDISALSVTDATDDVTVNVTSTSTSVQGANNDFQLIKKVAKR